MTQWSVESRQVRDGCIQSNSKSQIFLKIKSEAYPVCIYCNYTHICDSVMFVCPQMHL